MCFEAILKSLCQFSGKLTSVAPSSHKFSIYLLLLWTVSPEFCAQGECNIALSDTTEKKTFAAVNKPTSLKKQNFFVFKKRNYFNFWIPAAAPGSRCRLPAPCLTGGGGGQFLVVFFLLNCTLSGSYSAFCSTYISSLQAEQSGSAPLSRRRNHQPSFPPAATLHRHPQEHPAGWNPAHTTSPAGFESHWAWEAAETLPEELNKEHWCFLNKRKVLFTPKHSPLTPELIRGTWTSWSGAADVPSSLS